MRLWRNEGTHLLDLNQLAADDEQAKQAAEELHEIGERDHYQTHFKLLKKIKRLD